MLRDALVEIDLPGLGIERRHAVEEFLIQNEQAFGDGPPGAAQPGCRGMLAPLVSIGGVSHFFYTSAYLMGFWMDALVYRLLGRASH